MRLHNFGLLVIIILLLTCIMILFTICIIKVCKLMYGTYDKEHILPVHRVSSSFRPPQDHALDPRLIQTRIKFFRKPYKRMKESHARNMPPIVEVSTPVDSDAVPEPDMEDDSIEKVSVCTGKNGGVTNYWKRDTIIVVQ